MPQRLIKMATNGYSRAFLAGLAVSGVVVMGLVAYIHEGDVKRLDNLEHNVGVLLVEQGKGSSKMDALIERMAFIERRLR